MGKTQMKQSHLCTHLKADCMQACRCWHLSFCYFPSFFIPLRLLDGCESRSCNCCQAASCVGPVMSVKASCGFVAAGASACTPCGSGTYYDSTGVCKRESVCSSASVQRDRHAHSAWLQACRVHVCQCTHVCIRWLMLSTPSGCRGHFRNSLCCVVF